MEAKKREFIRENKIKGNVRESWDKLQSRAENRAARLAKEKQKRAYYKERNRRILLDNGILPADYPKGWQKMGLDRLMNNLPERKDTVLNSGDIWLYIGWGDRSGNLRAEDVFGGASGAWYKGISSNDLRDSISQTVNARGIDRSEGHAGDTVIMYGSYSEVKQYMEFCEQRGYQTIFFGNEFTEHNLLSYIAAALDSSPESLRSYIVGRTNGFLSAAGLNDLKIDV